MLWTILTFFAAISLVVATVRGRNAVWVGATIGFFAGTIFSLSIGEFELPIALGTAVLGILLGTSVEFFSALFSGGARRR